MVSSGLVSRPLFERIDARVPGELAQDSEPPAAISTPSAVPD